jgi:hypothetical protein
MLLSGVMSTSAYEDPPNKKNNNFWLQSYYFIEKRFAEHHQASS